MCFLSFFRRGAFGGFWGLLVGRSFFENEEIFIDLFNKELVNLSLKDMGSGQYNCSVLAIAFESLSGLAKASRLRPEKNTF